MTPINGIMRKKDPLRFCNRSSLKNTLTFKTSRTESGPAAIVFVYYRRKQAGAR